MRRVPGLHGFVTQPRLPDSCQRLQLEDATLNTKLSVKRLYWMFFSPMRPCFSVGPRIGTSSAAPSRPLPSALAVFSCHE